MVNINGNWIKLFSKFINWEWYKDQNTKSLFIHCLLKANWKDGKFEGIVVPRGSFVTGRKKLAQELGMTEQEIRTAIKHLILTNEITTEATNKYTIITVIKYEEYQQKKENSTNETTNGATNEQPTTNQQLTTIEEYKNKDNSVCNNSANQNFCHLGSIFKEESCFRCMKKRKCILPESPGFKLAHNSSFEEWNQEIEQLYEQWCIERKKHNESIDVDIFYYDWLNDKGEE